MNDHFRNLMMTLEVRATTSGRENKPNLHNPGLHVRPVHGEGLLCVVGPDRAAPRMVQLSLEVLEGHLLDVLQQNAVLGLHLPHNNRWSEEVLCKDSIRTLRTLKDSKGLYKDSKGL